MGSSTVAFNVAGVNPSGTGNEMELAVLSFCVRKKKKPVLDPPSSGSEMVGESISAPLPLVCSACAGGGARQTSMSITATSAPKRDGRMVLSMAKDTKSE